MCFKTKKCNWCGENDENINRINIWSKWYGLYICNNCYDNKTKNIGNKYPQYK